MNTSHVYIAVSVAVVAIVALVVFLLFRNRRENRLTPLAGLAFGFVLAGIFFGDERPIGYGLLGVGVVFAFVDMFRRSKSK
jgi:hypothetical protein